MASNKRLQRRSKLDIRCWVLVGLSLADAECRILDVSDSGARVEVPAGMNLDGEIKLFLTQDGSVSRTCEIVWRNDREVGLRFTNRPTQQLREL